jgi:hypothetical protein
MKDEVVGMVLFRALLAPERCCIIWRGTSLIMRGDYYVVKWKTEVAMFMKSKGEFMNTHPTHTIKKDLSVGQDVEMSQSHLFFESAGKRDGIKLAAVGGGEDELLVAGIPGYDAVFVVVILRRFTEELVDVLHRLMVCGSVLIAGSRFRNKGDARNILSVRINAELPGIVEINSPEGIEILRFLATPLQGINRGMRVEKDFGCNHSGVDAVHVQRLWGLGFSA